VTQQSQILGQYLSTLVSSSFQFSFLLDLALLILSALAFSLIFARLRLSIVAGQILAGVIVGPYVLGWVTDPLVLNQLAEVGVVLLLFIIGLELDPAELKKIIGGVTSLTLLEIGIAFAFGLLASYLLHFTLLEAIIFSMTASITSTAIVGKIFLSRRILRTPESGFLVGLLVIEDMIAVVFLIVLSAITSSNIGSFPYYVIGTSISSKGFFAALEAILGGLALIGLVYTVSHYVAPTIINHLSHFEEEFAEIPFLFALGLGFLFAVIAALLGYSPGTGAFIVGLSIRGKQSKFLSQRIAPIKDLFLVLFFVSMGALINPFPAFSLGGSIIIAMVLLIAGKFAGGFAIGEILNLQGKKLLGSPRERVYANGGSTKLASPRAFGAWLVPRGEFSLIIGQLGVALSIVSQQFFSLIGVSVIVTTIIGSIILRYSEPKKASSMFPFTSHKDEDQLG
jgi:CPA2 family monovalent cation:H+ antiporter-2